jgi:hypothetical protein
MPFYDLNRAVTTNASANTESTHMWAKTAANQETANITGIYGAFRFATAGGVQVNVKDNSGTTASGGTGQTPRPRNIRAAPAAQSTWANDGTAITNGTTLVVRLSIGCAGTGGMGGWVAPVPSAAFQMMPNATNPVDMEFTSNAAVASVTGNISWEFSEGQPT